MKRENKFHLDVVYFFDPFCPYCGLELNGRECDDMETLETVIFEYLNTDVFVCFDCMEALQNIKEKENG